jgi:hypothetical protein
MVGLKFECTVAIAPAIAIPIPSPPETPDVSAFPGLVLRTPGRTGGDSPRRIARYTDFMAILDRKTRHCIMAQIFGDYIDAPSTSNEFLVIGFSPSSIPLKQRWRNNGLSANFMADYVTTFFPKSEQDPEGLSRQSEIKSAVSFIANELLENAMKFSDDSSSYPIKIQLFLSSENLVFFVANSISSGAVSGFQNYIRELLSSDPEEMYVRQVEKNLDNDHQSGLGYLTMVNDYLAQLGWKFEEIPQDSSTLIVTTMVQLKI